MNTMIKLFETAARADRAGITVTRIGLVVVVVWIGSLKVFPYEDEGIVRPAWLRPGTLRGRRRQRPHRSQSAAQHVRPVEYQSADRFLMQP